MVVISSEGVGEGGERREKDFEGLCYIWLEPFISIYIDILFGQL
jgi:hypothetical protein